MFIKNLTNRIINERIKVVNLICKAIEKKIISCL
jgi:hypothetical protein